MESGQEKRWNFPFTYFFRLKLRNFRDNVLGRKQILPLGILYLYAAMILVADSGSTKTDWRWVGKADRFQTSGYNPYVQGMEAVLNALKQDLLPHLSEERPKAIYFYGSGFSVSEYNEALTRWLIQNTGATMVRAEHDLLGAARAICQNQAGIAAILGTGSNSCFFDGENIVQSKGGHGYLFGDEGSGAYLGKCLVQKILNEELSSAFMQQILERLSCSTSIELRNRIHGKPKPNVALAALAPLILELSGEAEIQEIILGSFRAFVKTTLLKYPQIEHSLLGFTGSVAQYFEKWLHQALSEVGLRASVILHKPIDQLVIFHERFG